VRGSPVAIDGFAEAPKYILDAFMRQGFIGLDEGGRSDDLGVH
jgi:hypothetical protein